MLPIVRGAAVIRLRFLYDQNVFYPLSSSEIKTWEKK